MKSIIRLFIFLFFTLGFLWAVPDDNSLVQDGAMNELTPYWRRYLNAKNGGQVELDTEIFESEPSSLRITNGTPEEYTGVRQVIEVISGKQYLFRCKIKTEDIMIGEKKGLGARVLIQSKEGTTLGFSEDLDEGSREWASIELVFVAPSDQIKIFLYLHHCAGTVWFDDVELLQD